MIDIHGFEHGVDLLFCHLNSKVLLVPLHDLLLVKRTVAIFVHEFEDLLQILLLLFAREVAGDEGHRRLLDLLVPSESI